MPEKFSAAKGLPEALKGALILTKVRYARYYIKSVPLKSALSSHYYSMYHMKPVSKYAP